MHADLFLLCRFVGLLAAGLLLPGWLLGRALGTPAGWAGAFLGSAALLTNLLLLLDGWGVPIDLRHLSLAWGLLCVGLAVVARLRRTESTIPPVAPPGIVQPGRWLLIPAGVGLLAIMVRAWLEPLSGWDCPFRWDFLAREIIRTGTLGFYPPISAGDFLHFGWCDGIAPLVSGLYAWSYLSLGRIEPWATTPVVIGQGLLIFYLTWRLAVARSGPAAGAAAAALLTLGPVLLWAVAMGQETGLTALSAVAMFWFIEQSRISHRIGWLIWAGLAAGTGALAREYGLCFPALGLVALAIERRPLRNHVALLAAAAGVVLPWYLRNWIKTGHPFYSFDLGPLFPVNPVHVEYMHLVAAASGRDAHSGGTVALLPTVSLLAGVPLIVGLVAGLFSWRRNASLLVALVAFFVLWLWLAGLTSGGGVYSMRALSPAIVIGAVLGGGWLARVAGSRLGWIVGVALGTLAVHAGVTSLYLPVDAQPAWWRESPLAWREFGRLRQQWSSHSRWRAIAEAADGRKVLVSDPFVHAILVDQGARPVPFFSPEVRFLFGASAEFEADSAHLRASGFRFILITRGNPLIDAQMAAHPFFAALAATTPVASGRLYFLYDLYPIAQRQPASPAPPTPP
jgi:hypothetical protein